MGVETFYVVARVANETSRRVERKTAARHVAFELLFENLIKMNQYIHIGAEVAAITALTIRFQRQLGKLEQRIELLENKLGRARNASPERRGPSVSIFETKPKPASTDFFMSFFPVFSKEGAPTPSTVSIHELEDDDAAETDAEPRPEDVKATFLKHLAFLADPESPISAS